MCVRFRFLHTTSPEANPKTCYRNLQNIKRLVIGAERPQIKGVKSTLDELHRDTAKLMKPVIHGKKALVITDHGEVYAKVVPLPGKPNRKRALAILRSMGALELPPRR